MHPELTHQALRALHKAALAISQELELNKVLQHIVDVARDLVGAQYAALGVPNDHGFLDAFIFSGMSQEEAKRMPHLPRGRGLLGAMIQEQTSLRVANIASDPRSIGFPEHHPQMSSFLGVPIMNGTKPIGHIYLTNKLDGPEFTEVDQEMVEMLAAHAAIAIKNARLYEEVERLAVVEERTRIGMDLHDGVIQSIFAVGLTLESTRLALAGTGQAGEEASQLLDTAVEGLNDAIRDIRNFILDLRPRRFQGDLGLSISRLTREFQANTLVPLQLDLPESLATLPNRTAHTLFLTTQEALANVARHAKASQVLVQLSWENGNQDIALIIEDNGRGFDPDDSARRIGHGLANMPARAADLGGQFDVISTPGSGTTIRMVLPTEN
ncbi:MAG: GAF domain-containing sensor histidine kinase [Anaerolineales bacterium]|nr:GAF domain-containing sensor histidine kinase [Anaerolineales bacterium]